MILNQSIARNTHATHGIAAIAPDGDKRGNRGSNPRVAPAAYYVTARQVRNAVGIGCLAGLLFVVAVCALMP